MTSFVPIDIWKQFGDQPKWRVEKPLRVIVMDGHSTVMLMRPDHGVKLPQATEGAFDSWPLLQLTNVKSIIAANSAPRWPKDGKYELASKMTPEGEKKIGVTVETKSGLPDGDYSKNHWMHQADLRKVYRFDAKTGRLEGMEAWLHQPDGDVKILDHRVIEYNQPIDPNVFALELPEKVFWVQGAGTTSRQRDIREDDAAGGGQGVF